MTRRMFDSVTADSIPAGATLVAGYADGEFENVAAMRTRFPHATVVTIAVAHTTRAMVADVERGDMTPETAVVWARDTMHDVPNTELTLYANTSTWPDVVAAFAAAGVSLPQWFAAQYDGVAELGPGEIAKQYVDTGGYDESVVADYWPGVDPVPTPPEDIVTPADIQAVAAATVELLLAHPFVDAGIKNPDGTQATRTLSELFSYLDLHHSVELGAEESVGAQVKAVAGQLAALTATVEKLAAAAAK